MTYGLRITNPSGTIVLDSEAIGYRFHSTPSVYSVGYYDYITQYPYTFRVTTSSAEDVPIVFLRPQLNITSKVAYVNLLSGSTWEIGVFGVSLIGHSESMRDQTVAAPIIHVFSRMTATAETYGLRLYNSAGQLTFDNGQTPLSIKGTISFSQFSGGYSPYSWSTGANALFNGDGQSFSGYTNLAVLGNPNCYGQVDSIGQSGEPADIWEWGWSLASGQLRRYRYWAGTWKGTYDLDWNNANLGFELGATTAFCIEASGL